MNKHSGKQTDIQKTKNTQTDTGAKKGLSGESDKKRCAIVALLELNKCLYVEGMLRLLVILFDRRLLRKSAVLLCRCVMWLWRDVLLLGNNGDTASTRFGR